MYKVFNNLTPVLIYSVNDFLKGLEVQPLTEETFNNALHSDTEIKYFVEQNEGQAIQIMNSLGKLIFAAGGVVKGPDGKILVIFRNGFWDLPKGKLESGENEYEAALREVEEECGIRFLEIVDTLPDTYHFYEQNGKYFFKRTFWFLMETAVSQMPSPQMEEGIEKVVWLEKRDFFRYMESSYASLKELLPAIAKKV